MLIDQKENLESVIYSLCFLQTPVFMGEEKDTVNDIKQFFLRLLGSNVFFLIILGILIIIVLIYLYNRQKSMPELEVKPIVNDTWFVNRDDNKRIGIVVSVGLMNKSTSGIYIKDCKLSGYSPKENPGEINIEDFDGKQKIKLDLPVHKHYCKGQDFYIGPYASENLWFYYESRSMTMSNLIETPLCIKDSRKKRKSIRISIPRHAHQIAIYEQMSRVW